MATILIIDDESDIRELLEDILRDAGHIAVHAYNTTSAFSQIEVSNPDIVILDIWLEGNHRDGIGLLKTFRTTHPMVPIIMISGHANIEIAVQTVKLGAYDFIEKPFKAAKLLVLLKRALETRALMEANNFLQQSLTDTSVIGSSKAMRSLREQIKQVAMQKSRVMIHGEYGVGKSTVAKAIHAASTRSDRPFVHLRTHGKTAEEIGNTLFSTHGGGKSLLEQAHCSTLFLDEIANIPIVMQRKIAQFIQKPCLVKSNDNEIMLDVRFIASTDKNPQYTIANNQIHEPLYTRLSTVSITIPPLRNRKQDIQLLSEYFIRKFSNEMSVTDCFISDRIYSAMVAYDWPGNVKQLQNTIEGLLISAHKLRINEITVDMLPNAMLEFAANKYHGLNIVTDFMEKRYKDAKTIFETEYLKAQLTKFDGNVAKTASFIGMDRTALHRKIKSLNLPVECTDE